MKKNYFISILLICLGALHVSEAQAQKKRHTDRYYNSWRLGLNVGGMWQTSDVRRASAGSGAGFTLEKAFHENATNFLSFAIKGRGLWGNTYGLDYGRNYNVYYDPALNGKYNPGVNYDSVAATGGAPFIYNNYKTKIAEGALEFQICFNSLREKTNVLLNLWGGIGFTSYRTKLNLLNSKNQMYNYYLVDSSGSSALILNSHKALLDGSYESNANVSQNGNVLTWSPSCGIGLGYRFNDHISLIWEYKVTFPQGVYADYLDGFEKHNNDWIGCNKDYYHYTGLNMTIRLGGRGGKAHSTDVNNYTNANTNTVVTNQTNSLVTNPTQTVVTKPVQPPVVTITNPPYSPYNETANRNFTINATVQHVNKRNEVHITFNGNEVKNYSWIGKYVSFVEPLNVGNNIVSITATNAAGSDSKSATINYSGVPPQISITTPGTNKYTSNADNSDIFATILNVEAPQNISVTLNTQLFPNFSYDVNTKVFSMNAALITGTNTINIVATNAFGQDQKTQLIIYKPTTTVGSTVVAAKPVTVVITDPPVNPYKSNGIIYNVKSKVTGVTAQNQVTVTVNSNPVPFNYNNGAVDFNVSLSAGTNLIQVNARNGRQADSKSTVITYEGPKKVTPPTVVIINPNPSPYATTGNTYPFKAQTSYITDRSQLEVKYNGNVISDYTFNATTGFIDYNSNLTLNSNNVLEVKATNAYGTANASAIVKQEQPKTKVICHRVDRGTMQTTTILESEWIMHQAHGDYEGPCQKSEDPQPDPQITICHLNGDGSKQTISILQSQWAQHQAHGDVMGACPKVMNEIPDNDITICHKNADGSKQTMVIKESAWLSHQAHGDVRGTCPKILTETPDNDITICHKNADGSKQTMVIKESAWLSHQAHGDVRGTCPKILNEIPDPDMVICHKNGDGSSVKMTIKTSEWPGHQAHGDYVGGECSANTNTSTTTNTVEICHNNGDGTKSTIIIPSDQYAAHRAHGDVLGKCPVVTNTVQPTMTICHNNGDGSKSTITITADQWATHQAHGDISGTCPPDPSITICHNNGDGSKTTMTILQSQWSSHQSHGDVQGTCPPDPSITICHNNGDGSKTTMTILQSQWSSHQSHGDVQGACPPEDKKITICHIPPGNTGNPQTIEISESAWPAHQAHGDTKGECTASNNNNSGNNNNNEPGNNKIQICHIPPGNNQNPQTIEISENAWPAHEAHGDSKQPCAPGEKKITICHIPPGNPNNPQTIEIAESAWPAHQAHGDTKGACDDGKGKGGNGNGNDKGKSDVKDETENGTKVPGRTNTTEQPQTTEPQKTQEPLKMKPR